MIAKGCGRGCGVQVLAAMAALALLAVISGIAMLISWPKSWRSSLFQDQIGKLVYFRLIARMDHGSGI